MIRRLFMMAAAATLVAAGTAQAAKLAPAELQPAGAKPVLTVHARGVQIYRSVAGPDGHFKWMFEAPLAQLEDGPGKVIYHYAGPSWEAPDGSKVARNADVPVKSAEAPRAAADIPWLLVTVTPDSAPGALAAVGFVQRLDTHGGQPPTAAPTRADTRVGVPYTATYVFLTKAP